LQQQKENLIADDDEEEEKLGLVLFLLVLGGFCKE
jgi:hypothetical protein